MVNDEFEISDYSIVDGVDGWVLEAFDWDEDKCTKTFIYYNRMLKRRRTIVRPASWKRMPC